MEQILKRDLESIKNPSYPGDFPPFYLCDYCKRILSELEGLQDEDRKVRFLCGMANDLFRLGFSKGTATTRATVIANLFKEK